MSKLSPLVHPIVSRTLRTADRRPSMISVLTENHDLRRTVQESDCLERVRRSGGSGGISEFPRNSGDEQTALKFLGAEGTSVLFSTILYGDLSPMDSWIAADLG